MGLDASQITALLWQSLYLSVMGETQGGDWLRATRTRDRTVIVHTSISISGLPRHMLDSTILPFDKSSKASNWIRGISTSFTGCDQGDTHHHGHEGRRSALRGSWSSVGKGGGGQTCCPISLFARSAPPGVPRHRPITTRQNPSQPRRVRRRRPFQLSHDA